MMELFPIWHNFKVFASVLRLLVVSSGGEKKIHIKVAKCFLKVPELIKQLFECIKPKSCQINAR